MTHVGQELALGAGSGFGSVFAVAQFAGAVLHQREKSPFGGLQGKDAEQIESDAEQNQR